MASDVPSPVSMFSDTPSDDINQAVADAMGGLSMEDLLKQVSQPAGPAADLDPARPLRGGRPQAAGPEEPTAHSRDRRGRVIAIRDRSIFVDLGGKSQGVAPLEQFSDGQEEPVIGQEYDFTFTGYDNREGLVLLSRRGAVNHGSWDELHEGDVVEGMVSGSNKGGLEITINNIRAFMPAGQVDIRFNSDLNALVGQKIKCQVTEVDRAARRLIVSRRDILEQQAAVEREKTWNELATGQIREGVVTSVQAYGAFVDIGSVDGLLHVSAMSHTRVADPTKILKPGDRVQVMVLAVDREKQRISLGLKQLQKDPWSTVAQDFPVGIITEASITRLLDFGAFAELAPGVEGLIHISELATRRVSHTGQVVKPGDKLAVKVLAVDMEKKRISLSAAQAQREGTAAGGESALGVPAENTHASSMPGLVKPGGKTPKKSALRGGL
ncbi:MAG: 30S ribosomal protein S1 [Phycisphaerae bacterium]